MDRRIFKKKPEELQQFFAFRRRGFSVPSKKGRKAYTRHKKHRSQSDEV